MIRIHIEEDLSPAVPHAAVHIGKDILIIVNAAVIDMEPWLRSFLCTQVANGFDPRTRPVKQPLARVIQLPTARSSEEIRLDDITDTRAESG